MPDGRYSVPRPLSLEDDLASFACGEGSLDAYLRVRAYANHTAGGSRCYVTIGGGRVVGYYTLAAASVRRSDTSGRVRRQMPDPIPVVLLGRLAVDLGHQGAGLGRGLLKDAVLRTLQASERIGVRALVVNALSDAAAAFYRAHGFESSITDPHHLMVLLQDARGPLS